MAYEYVIIACVCAIICATPLNAASINKIANAKSITETQNQRLQEARFAREDENESMLVSASEDADTEEMTPFRYSAKLEAEILSLKGSEAEQITDRKHRRLPRNVANVKTCPLHFIRKNGMCISCQKLSAC